MRALIGKLVRRAVHADAFEVRHRARIEALEAQLGPSDGMVMRPNGRMAIGGFSDVLRFHNHVDGVTYSTCDLIGDDRQQPNRFGAYELAICTRNEDEWAPQIVSRLAHATRKAAFNIGELIDIAEYVPEDATICGFMFEVPDTEHPYFTVMGYPASILLCVGLTAPEMGACREHGVAPVLRLLRENHVFPYTDLYRPSLV